VRRFAAAWLSLVVTCVALVQAGGAAAPGRQTSADATAAMMLVRGTPIEREIGGGQSHLYRLSLDAGQFAAITVDQHGIDVVTRVEDAAGTARADFDLDTRADGREPIGVIGDPSGTVFLRVTPRFSRDPAARYEIHVDEVRAATDRDRDAFVAHQLFTQAVTLRDIAVAYAAKSDGRQATEYQARANQAYERNIGLSLAIGSEREKLLYADAIATWTNRAISLHVHQAPTYAPAAEAAALVLLQRKGRVLDAIAGNMEALRERMTADDRALLDRLQATTVQLATLSLNGPGRTPLDAYQQQLKSMEQQREQLESEIGSRSGEFHAQSQPVTVAAVQRAIPDDAALIEFAVYQPFDPKALTERTAYGAPHYVAYVLRHHGEVRWRELGPAKAIDDAVVALRQALRDPHGANPRPLSRALDDKVLRPLRPLVRDARRLLISPDGGLNRIPFEVLIDERGRFAVQRQAITYLTSGRDLLRMQTRRPSRGAPLIVADPFFDHPPVTGPHRGTKLTSREPHPTTTNGDELSTLYFSPLPATGDEARAIKALYPEATMLSGPRATKAALTNADAPIILHIATHGFFLDDATPALEARVPGTRAISATTTVKNPLLRSGLAFSGANLAKRGAEEGILTALEASTLNLWGTNLVTLSACDTGMGDVKNGEGVYGLRRAFLLAGAETVVMSLWPVSDYVTREMMTTYYRGLKRGLGRGEALRHAQLAMLARPERQHPFYWASFIQVGEWANFDGRR
jgi:CHAT domain-containing protein